MEMSVTHMKVFHMNIHEHTLYPSNKKNSTLCAPCTTSDHSSIDQHFEQQVHVLAHIATEEDVQKI